MRLTLIANLVLTPALGASAADTLAQPYPSRAIRYIVPFAPGGGQDAVARQLAPRLTEALGQPIVIDNRPGAGATIGAEIAAKSPPDGYTIFMASNTTHAINPHLYQKLGYDPIRDFAAVSQIASLANILVVHPSLPARSLRQLTALAKSRPGELHFGSPGNGTPAQLAGVMYNQAAGVQTVHVPYRGSGPALTSLLSGETQFMFGSMTSAIPLVKAGRLRALAVTGSKRSGAVPDVPTVAESGYPGFEATTWYGIAVPAGTPPAIVTRLHAAIVKVLAIPDMRAAFEAQGAETVGNAPAEFAAYIAAELKRYAKIVRDSGMRVD